jgi:iron-sulfur cluster repair protein YtfE (RIC family)
MKATTLLERQHRKVEAIFRKLEGKKTAPGPLLLELANDLAAHMTIEQEIFYPAIQGVDPDLVAENYEEHALAEIALKRLLGTSPGSEDFRARVVTLRELLEHHVHEEETDLFPRVEKKLDGRLLDDLGKQMKVRFQEVVEAGFEVALPHGFAETSADASRRVGLNGVAAPV